jgi:hypothetical protein
MKLVSRILAKGDAHCGGAYPFYLICQKRIPTDYSSRDSPYVNTQHAHCTHMHKYVCKQTRAVQVQEEPRGAQAI